MRSIVHLSTTRVACAFRTVSHKTVGVITGLMPPGIMAMKHERVFDKTKTIDRHLTSEERKQEKQKKLNEWTKS